MKEAYESGKKPRFHRGKLYIDGNLLKKFIDVLIIVRLVSNYRAIREIGKCFKSAE